MAPLMVNYEPFSYLLLVELDTFQQIKNVQLDTISPKPFTCVYI